jgi:hypothetical protein
MIGIVAAMNRSSLFAGLCRGHMSLLTVEVGAYAPLHGGGWAAVSLKPM